MNERIVSSNIHNDNLITIMIISRIIGEGREKCRTQNCSELGKS
jgi:hypothetical protein